MPGASKEIQRRIKSIRATRKITKAMELVAAAKMRKSQTAVLESRPYAREAWKVVMNLVQKVDPSAHPLLSVKEPFLSLRGNPSIEGIATSRRSVGTRNDIFFREPNRERKVLLVLIASDKGLCGSLNAQVCGKAGWFLKQTGNEHVDVVTVGRKAREWARRMRLEVVADFTNLGSIVHLAEMRPIAKLALDDFRAEKYAEVFVAYTDFVSTLKQEPRIKKLLPLQAEEDSELGFVGEGPGREGADREPGKALNRRYEYLFEPSPEQVFDTTLPRIVTLQLYQAILESNASEHSARMVAMKNATDAAGDMLSDLSLAFNQARQAAITQEIAEIATASAAMGG